MKKIFSTKHIIAFCLITVTLVFCGRLFTFQVLEEEQKNCSDVSEKAKYGNILDRNGIVLWDRHFVKDNTKEDIYYFSNLTGLNGILKSIAGNEKIAWRMQGQDGTTCEVIKRKKIKDKKKIDPKIDGENIRLSIDSRIQEIVESAINEFVPKFEAEGASISVLDSRTGQILALTSFNQNSKKYDGEIHSFEPGSIMKPITAMIALENGVDPNKKILVDTENGKARWRVTKNANDKPIGDTHLPKKCLETATCEVDMQTAMAESSNIAFGKYVVDEIGYQNFYVGLQNFGIGQNGKDFPLKLEQTALTKGNDKRTQAAQGFGQSVDLTALDLTKAFGAIANGGILYNPKLILNKENKITDAEKDSVRKVLSATDNSRILREMLRSVLTEGTAKNVKTKYGFFEFAGKTGTAQFRDSTGKYSTDGNNSSFIGMENADNPHFICLVTIHNTKKAGAAAGIVFQKIMEQIFIHPALSPRNFNKEFAAVDNICKNISFIDYSKEDALNKARGNCNIKFAGENGRVVQQRVVRSENEMYLELSLRETQSHADNMNMPDVRGLYLNNALQMLERFPNVVSDGVGRVVQQIPQAGAPTNKNEKVILKLSEQNLAKSFDVGMRN